MTTPSPPQAHTRTCHVEQRRATPTTESEAHPDYRADESNGGYSNHQPEGEPHHANDERYRLAKRQAKKQGSPSRIAESISSRRSPVHDRTSSSSRADDWEALAGGETGGRLGRRVPAAGPGRVPPL